MSMIKMNYEIEDAIKEICSEKIKEIGSELVTFLRFNGMEFERGKGYWENQLYWYVKYKNEIVCYILVNGSGDEKEFAPLTIWSDDSGSKWYENDTLSEKLREIAWNYVDVCVQCGACAGGKSKIVFGKQFENICRTTMRFINPEKEALNCIMKLIEMRKEDIVTKISTK